MGVPRRSSSSFRGVPVSCSCPAGTLPTAAPCRGTRLWLAFETCSCQDPRAKGTAREARASGRHDRAVASTPIERAGVVQEVGWVKRGRPGAWGHLAASRPLSGGLGPLMAGSATRGPGHNDSDARQLQATAGQGGAHASLGLGPYTPNRRPLHSSSARPGRHSVGRCSRPSLRGAKPTVTPRLSVSWITKAHTTAPR